MSALPTTSRILRGGESLDRNGAAKKRMNDKLLEASCSSLETEKGQNAKQQGMRCERAREGLSKRSSDRKSPEQSMPQAAPGNALPSRPKTRPPRPRPKTEWSQILAYARHTDLAHRQRSRH